MQSEKNVDFNLRAGRVCRAGDYFLLAAVPGEMMLSGAFYESAKKTVRDDFRGAVSLADLGDVRLAKLADGLRIAVEGRRKALKEMKFPSSAAGDRCKERFAEETARYLARLRILEEELKRRRA